MHSTCFPVSPIKELEFWILLAKNGFGPGLLNVMLFWMEFNNLLLNHLKRVGFKRHFSVETSKKESVCVFVCASVSSSGSPKWCQSPLAEKLQLCVNYSGSSGVLVLSKCVMMAVYSVEETRDNIQLLMDRMKEMGPQGNTAEIHIKRRCGRKGLGECLVEFSSIEKKWNVIDDFILTVHNNLAVCAIIIDLLDVAKVYVTEEDAVGSLPSTTMIVKAEGNDILHVIGVLKRLYWRV